MIFPISYFYPVGQSRHGGNPYNPYRKELPEAKDAAGHGPPRMLRIAATTSAGSIRTV